MKLGSNAAQEILFKDLKFSADNYAKELSGEWQDIYVSTDAALNGLNNMPYLKFLGKGEADIQIDCIYMTNTVPEGYEAGRAVEQQGGNDGEDVYKRQRLDGCTSMGVFSRIILPMSKPITMVITVLTVNASWSDFLMPYLVLKDKDKMTVMVKIYDMANSTVSKDCLLYTSRCV